MAICETVDPVAMVNGYTVVVAPFWQYARNRACQYHAANSDGHGRFVTLCGKAMDDHDFHCHAQESHEITCKKCLAAKLEKPKLGEYKPLRFVLKVNNGEQEWIGCNVFVFAASNESGAVAEYQTLASQGKNVTLDREDVAECLSKNRTHRMNTYHRTVRMMKSAA